MTLNNFARTTATLGILLAASAVAQTRFCIGGDLDHLSQAERATCDAKVQAVRTVASSLHAPGDWHFVVVCGKEGWKEYAAYTMEPNPALLDASADTNLEQHETFLRADRLDLDQLRSLQHVVAHEVAGVLLNSKNELAINHQVQLWEASKGAGAGL